MPETLDLSTYNLEDNWINNIAKKYFDITDINLLKVGLFGYVNEVMASAVEDHYEHELIMSNEIFPNKAVIPNSIYAYTALARYDDFNAKPSTIYFSLIMKKDDIIKQSVDTKYGYKELIIKKYSRLIVDDTIPFMLDYDIRIISTYSKEEDDYLLSAQYIIDSDNPLSTIRTPYIKSVVTNFDNNKYLFMQLVGHQVDRQEKTFSVYSNDTLEQIYFDIEYEGKLADFNVFYRKNNSSETIQLTKYLVDSYKPDAEYFCFYNFVGENLLSINFSAHPSYFKPEFNSTLIVEIYTTLGSQGNFNYKGLNCSFEYYTDGDSNIFSKITTFCTVLSNATGGADEESLEEIKNKVIIEFSSRGNLITDLDLNNFFRARETNSQVIFTKKRDDLIERVYSAFFVLRDENSYVYPTNTLNCEITEDQFDNHREGETRYTIKAGRIFELSDVSSRTAHLISNNKYSEEEIKEIDNSKDHYLYSSPFLINVDTNPFFVSFYLNSVYKNYMMDFSYLNRYTIDQFIINNVELIRDALTTDQYEIRFNLVTNLPFENVFELGENNEIIDKGNLLLKGVFNLNGENIGYINFKLVGYSEEDTSLEYVAYLTTNDYITSNNEINIIESVYSIDPRDEILKESLSLSCNGLILQIPIFYNGYENKTKGPMNNLIPNLDNYCITTMYDTTEFQLFNNLNNIMKSTFTLDKSSNTFRLAQIPLIRTRYLQNEDIIHELVDLLDDFRLTLNEILSITENNFNIDMKFFNTFGPSFNFTIGSDGEEFLNRTAISLDLNIKINTELTSELINSIKTFIIKFVESSNSTNDLSYFYVSNLIRQLETNFDEISFVEFNNINGYSTDNQIIEATYSNKDEMTREQRINYIPEYISINRIFTTNEYNEEILTPEINIKFL